MKIDATFRASILCACCVSLVVSVSTATLAEEPNFRRFTPAALSYSPGPADNPLKGLVPYQRPHPDRFPYSMEFNYLPLSALVKDPDQYDWAEFDKMLDDIASRGHQTVTRVFLEYPGKQDVIPPFLIKNGLKVHRYINTNTAPLPPASIETPDYEDRNLRTVMTKFIAAWGKRYDGDHRLAYITAGMLGTWGEWHTFPRTELWASKVVQKEILDAFDSSFKITPVLLRYPAGANDHLYADSTPYAFGYHDDSFAHSTLETGNPADEWFFWPKVIKAGLADRWKTAPIGGEIRPEVWGCCFDEKPCTAESQSFDECRDVTHATWLMDTGMNREVPSRQRYDRAIEAVQKMGYDLEVTESKVVNVTSDGMTIEVTIKNRGIAPFYHHGWHAKLEMIRDEEVVKAFNTDWSPRMIMPDEPKLFSQTIDVSDLRMNDVQLRLSFPNPMSGGMPIRFANTRCDPKTGGLILGKFEVDE